MVAKEFYLEEESTLLQEKEKDDDPLLLEDQEDDDEALSLCDLPLYSNDSSSSSSSVGSMVRDDYFDLSRSKEEEDDDDDFFEFFSEEFITTSTKTNISDNIIFCGKLIPYKEADGKNNIHRQKGTLVHPWKNYNDNINSKKGQKVKKGEKSNFTCEHPSIGKVSLMRSTTKSRWLFFMFGMSRLPSNNGMELSDIRSRQSRSRSHSHRTKFAAVAPPEAKEKRNNNCKGLWRAFRSISYGLGCRSSKLANDAVVKAAFM
ncbi:hypothetical protein HN51_056170 [Arachis hypogaea]|uniref:Uncharacterized protein n=1 Tax=Arachis hypogaea TaxID=3818 RepID=A0A6B9VF87_ARAHY|nr:uncharacterized protein DS421_19g666150 [Arachis hypogaea]